MSRIFKLFANGYGPTPVEIVAQIDGNTVYSGTVSTVDTPVPDYIALQPGQFAHSECFSWIEPTTWVQSIEPTGNAFVRSLSITVSNGTLQLGQILAQSNVANADQYNVIYHVTIEDVDYGDPLSNVVIGGESMTRPIKPYPGQWHWNIPSGTTLTATINCNIPMARR